MDANDESYDVENESGEFDIDLYDFHIVEQDDERISSQRLARQFLNNIVQHNADFTSHDNIEYEELEAIERHDHTLQVESAVDQIEFAKIQKENVIMTLEMQEQAYKSKKEIDKINKLKESLNILNIKKSQQIENLEIAKNKGVKLVKELADGLKDVKKVHDKTLEDHKSEIETLRDEFEKEKQKAKNETERLQKQLAEQKSLNKNQIEHLRTNVYGESKISEAQITELERQLAKEHLLVEEQIKNLQNTNAKGQYSKKQIEDIKELLALKENSNIDIEKLKIVLKTETKLQTKKIENLEIQKSKESKKSKIDKLNKELVRARKLLEAQVNEAQKLITIQKDVKNNNKILRKVLVLEERQKKGINKKYIKEITNRNYKVLEIKTFFRSGAGSFGVGFNTTERGIYVTKVKTDGNPQVAKYPEVKVGCLLSEVIYFERNSTSGRLLKVDNSKKLISKLAYYLGNNHDIIMKFIVPPDEYTNALLDQKVMSKKAKLAWQKQQNKKKKYNISFRLETKNFQENTDMTKINISKNW